MCLNFRTELLVDGTRADNAAPWTRADGTLLTWTNWDTDDPKEDEHCMKHHIDHWDSIKCTAKRFSHLCEADTCPGWNQFLWQRQLIIGRGGRSKVEWKYFSQHDSSYIFRWHLSDNNPFLKCFLNNTFVWPWVVLCITPNFLFTLLRAGVSSRPSRLEPDTIRLFQKGGILHAFDLFHQCCRLVQQRLCHVL